MKKYDTYKDSGIEWIGEIPEHWSVVKLKYVTLLQGGFAFKSAQFTEEGNAIVRIGDIADTININSCKKYPLDENISDEFKIVENDTLIALSGATVGKSCFINENIENCYINQRVARVKADNKFLHYNIIADYFQKQIRLSAGGSAQENISNGQIENFYIPKIHNTEQTAIVSFLDHKTTQIDTLIEKKEQLVDKLTLKRQAIINEAVTKGLNPDVPMKDSGIEWLGEIPEHWEVVSLKYLVNHSTTKGDGKSELKVALENIESQTGIYLESEKKEFEGELKEFKKDDILFNKLRPYLAKVFKAPEDGECVSELLVFTCLSPVLTPDFLFWKLISQQVISVVDSSTYGAKMPRVGTDFMLNLPITLPLKEEQEEIIKHITNKIKVIDDTSGKAKESIEKLKLYRQSLISEAVTGKIDLRDWKQPHD